MTKILINIYSSICICIFDRRVVVGCQRIEVIMFVISRGEKRSCLGPCRLWNYINVSVIHFCVPSCRYLMMMMVCV